MGHGARTCTAAATMSATTTATRMEEDNNHATIMTCAQGTDTQVTDAQGNDQDGEAAGHECARRRPRRTGRQSRTHAEATQMTRAWGTNVHSGSIGDDGDGSDGATMTTWAPVTDTRGGDYDDKNAGHELARRRGEQQPSQRASDDHEDHDEDHNEDHGPSYVGPGGAPYAQKNGGGS